MSIKKKVPLSNQNDEPIIAKVLKNEEYRNRDLEDINIIDKSTIELVFSDTVYSSGQKRRVAQIKKKKCDSEEEVKKMFEEETVDKKYFKTRLWSKVWVFDLSNKWLVFCKR